MQCLNPLQRSKIPKYFENRLKLKPESCELDTIRDSAGARFLYKMCFTNKSLSAPGSAFHRAFYVADCTGRKNIFM